MNRQDIIWWGGVAFWIGVTAYLWIRAYRVGKRDEARKKHREEVLEDQKTLLMIADYLTEKERATWDDCANEPDLEFQLRRSNELQAEKNSRDLAS